MTAGVFDGDADQPPFRQLRVSSRERLVLLSGTVSDGVRLALFQMGGDRSDCCSHRSGRERLAGRAGVAVTRGPGRIGSFLGVPAPASLAVTSSLTSDLETVGTSTCSRARGARCTDR